MGITGKATEGVGGEKKGKKGKGGGGGGGIKTSNRFESCFIQTDIDKLCGG